MMATENNQAGAPGNKHTDQHKGGGGHPPLPHKPAKAKLVERGTTQNSNFTKKTCEMITLAAECEHDGRKAVKEDGEWTLSVVPHDGGLKHAGNTMRSGGVGTKPIKSASEEKQEEKNRDTTHEHLKDENAELKKRSAELAARRNQNTRNYRQTATRLNHDKGSYTARNNEFIRDNKTKNYFSAELYLDQGNPAVSDKVTFHVKTAKKCSKHPAWGLWDCSVNKWVETYQGEKWETEALLPPVIDYSTMPSVLPKHMGFSNAYWLKGVHPRFYKANLYTCDAHEVVHISVYPLVESGIHITLKREGSREGAKGSWASRIQTCRDRFEALVNIISHVAPGGGSWHVEIFPEGTFSLLNKWAEEEKTNEVVWEAEVEVGATVAEIKIVRPLIAGLPEWVMKKIRKAAEAGVDITLTLGAEVAVSASWKQAPEKQLAFSSKGNITGTGNLALTAYATAHLAILRLHRTVHIEIGGSTEIQLESTLEREPKEERLHVKTTGHWTHPLTAFGTVTWGVRRNQTRSFRHDVLGPLPPHEFGEVALW